MYGKEKTEQRGGKNEEICFDNGISDANEVTSLSEFLCVFPRWPEQIFWLAFNRARRKRHDEIIDRRVIFYFFFFFLSPLPRVRNFERHWDNNLKNYGDRKKILSI